MTRLALQGIAEIGDNDLFSSFEWFEPFRLEREVLMSQVLPAVLPQSRREDGCGLNRSFKPFPLLDSEPDGTLLTGPAARCGLASLIAKEEGRSVLTAAWPFISDGVQIDAEVDKLILAPDRLQAFVEATLWGELQLSWLDIFFAADRAFYAEGSRHSFLLAGIAHEFAIGQQPDVVLPPSSPTFAVLRDAQPESVDRDGNIRIKMKGMAAILPAEMPGWFSICGVVTKVSQYPCKVFERDVWDVRVIAARSMEEDRSLELAVFVTDAMFEGNPLPEPGDDISALVRLQARIWMPNLEAEAV